MLSQKKCVPCTPGSPPMDAVQVALMLKELPGWELTLGDRAIKRRFAFKNFVQALAMVNKVGEIAEAEGHHPDILLGWGYAEFVLWTHSIAGLHENDFIIASKISELDKA
jgi:4a-hydroxytetrahydrobiopterin dehydratase